jgi:SAM-dependent methyltransferase
MVTVPMNDPKTIGLRNSYDRVADEYARRIADELRHKPLDRQLLDRSAAQVKGRGVACDMGCGPGHVARYLHERGVSVIGVDLSSGMVDRARQLNPEIEFRQGTMLALDFPNETWAGIAAFYSIIHIDPAEIGQALRELKRVLRPGGVLLLAFHVGEEIIHLDEWWGQKVSVDFFFLRPQQVAISLQSAGFVVDEIIERAPYPEVEHPSRRAYVFARKPDAEPLVQPA